MLYSTPRDLIQSRGDPDLNLSHLGHAAKDAVILALSARVDAAAMMERYNLIMGPRIHAPKCDVGGLSAWRL